MLSAWVACQACARRGPVLRAFSRSHLVDGLPRASSDSSAGVLAFVCVSVSIVVLAFDHVSVSTVVLVLVHVSVSTVVVALIHVSVSTLVLALVGVSVSTLLALFASRLPCWT